jgi:hypothetical protein
VPAPHPTIGRLRLLATLPGGEVCGCDGKTYAGDCERRTAQVGKAKEGKCDL